jgi:hypothetical protein
MHCNSEISKYYNYLLVNKTRPAWAGFKTAEEGRAKICKFFMAKVEEQK